MSDDFDLDDFDLDGFGFTGDEFDGAESAGDKKDRKPVEKIGAGIKEGAKRQLLSESTRRKLVRESLPDGYGDAYDAAGEVIDLGRDLYDTTATALRPARKGLKKITKTLLPEVEGVLPKFIKDKLEEFANEADDANLGGGDFRETEIETQLGDIFKTQMQHNETLDDKEEARAVISEQAEQKRHTGTLGYLDDMRSALSRMVGYQDDILSAYQRKHLEIEYRQLYASQDLLASFNEYRALNEDALKVIAKNTALPEHVKVRTGELAGQMFRQRLIGDMQESTADYMSNYLTGMRDNLIKKVKTGATDFAQRVSDASEALDMMKEGNADNYEMLGDVAGSFGADKAATWVAAQLKKITSKSEFMAKQGLDAEHMFRHRNVLFKELLEKTAKKYGKNSEEYGHVEDQYETFEDWESGDSKKKPGMLQKIASAPGKAFKRLLGFAADEALELANKQGVVNTIGVNEDTLADEALAYNALADKAITQIIPGLLSDILQVNEKMLTGNDKIERKVYNYKRDEFTREGVLRDDIMNSVLSDNDLSAIRGELFQLADLILDSDVSPTVRSDFTRKALEFISENRSVSPDNWLEPGALNDLPEESRKIIIDSFHAKLVGDDGKVRDTVEAKELRNKFTSYGEFVRTKVPNIQNDLAKQTQFYGTELIKDLGLASVGKNGATNVNKKEILDYINGNKDSLPTRNRELGSISEVFASNERKLSGFENLLRAMRPESTAANPYIPPEAEGLRTTLNPSLLPGGPEAHGIHQTNPVDDQLAFLDGILDQQREGTKLLGWIYAILQKWDNNPPWGGGPNNPNGPDGGGPGGLNPDGTVKFSDEWKWPGSEEDASDDGVFDLDDPYADPFAKAKNYMGKKRKAITTAVSAKAAETRQLIVDNKDMYMELKNEYGHKAAVELLLDDKMRKAKESMQMGGLYAEEYAGKAKDFVAEKGAIAKDHIVSYGGKAKALTLKGLTSAKTFASSDPVQSRLQSTRAFATGMLNTVKQNEHVQAAGKWVQPHLDTLGQKVDNAKKTLLNEMESLGVFGIIDELAEKIGNIDLADAKRAEYKDILSEFGFKDGMELIIDDLKREAVSAGVRTYDYLRNDAVDDVSDKYKTVKAYFEANPVTYESVKTAVTDKAAQLKTYGESLGARLSDSELVGNVKRTVSDALMYNTPDVDGAVDDAIPLDRIRQSFTPVSVSDRWMSDEAVPFEDMGYKERVQDFIASKADSLLKYIQDKVDADLPDQPDVNDNVSHGLLAKLRAKTVKDNVEQAYVEQEMLPMAAGSDIVASTGTPIPVSGKKFTVVDAVESTTEDTANETLLQTFMRNEAANASEYEEELLERIKDAFSKENLTLTAQSVQDAVFGTYASLSAWVSEQKQKYSKPEMSPVIEKTGEVHSVADNSELVTAIRDLTGTTVSIDEKLAMLLERGLLTRSANDGEMVDGEEKPGRLKRAWDYTKALPGRTWEGIKSIPGKGMRGAWAATKALGKGYWWATKKSAKLGLGAAKLGAKGAWGATKLAANQGLGFGKGLLGIKDDVADVYLKGEDKPVITKRALVNGLYTDKETGEPIKTFKDIKGPVVDAEGNTVITQEDLDNDMLVTPKGRSIGNRVGGIVRGAAIGLGRFTATGYGAMWRATKWMYGKTKDVFKRYLGDPHDVYVKGESKPRLLRTLFLEGAYFDAKSGNVIEKVKDIKGPVKDAEGNVLLSAQDLAKGIHGPLGKLLRIGLGVAKGVLKAGWATIKFTGRVFGAMGKLLGKGIGGISRAVGRGVRGVLNIAPKDPIMANVLANTQTNEILADIHDLLETRIPIPEVIRKGSWKDKLLETKEKSKDETPKEGVDKDKSLLKGLGGKLAGLLGFGGKGDDDDDEGDVSDTLEDMANAKDLTDWGGGGDGDDSRRRRRRRRPRRGRRARTRLGRLVQNIRYGGQRLAHGAANLFRGGLTSTVGRVAMGAGRLALGGGKFVAGLAVKGVTALAGIVGAPVLIGAAAVALVAGGAYLLWRRHKGTPKGLLHEYRLTQYGIDVKSKDHVRRLGAMEELLGKHVSYDSDGKAKLNELPDKVLSELADIFDVKTDNDEHMRNFSVWFQNRGKVVFLTHLTALKGLDVKTKLDEVDKGLSDAEKLKYLDNTILETTTYSTRTSPFADDDSRMLPAIHTDVTAAYEKAKASLDLKDEKPKEEAKTVKEVVKPIEPVDAVKPVAATDVVADMYQEPDKRPELPKTTLPTGNAMALANERKASADAPVAQTPADAPRVQRTESSVVTYEGPEYKPTTEHVDGSAYGDLTRSETAVAATTPVAVAATAPLITNKPTIVRTAGGKVLKGGVIKRASTQNGLVSDYVPLAAGVLTAGAVTDISDVYKKPFIAGKSLGSPTPSYTDTKPNAPVAPGKLETILSKSDYGLYTTLEKDVRDTYRREVSSMSQVDNHNRVMTSSLLSVADALKTQVSLQQSIDLTLKEMRDMMLEDREDATTTVSSKDADKKKRQAEEAAIKKEIEATNKRLANLQDSLSKRNNNASNRDVVTRGVSLTRQ